VPYSPLPKNNNNNINIPKYLYGNSYGNSLKYIILFFMILLLFFYLYSFFIGIIKGTHLFNSLLDFYLLQSQ
jgi:hypothetical protein